MLVRLIIALIIPTILNAHVFMFFPTTKTTNLDNWQNNERPCKDDHIIFEESKKTVAFIDSSIGVSQMQLPDDGVIYFGDDVTLGMEQNYQCERRKSPEDVFFEPETSFASYFNPDNWQHDHAPILHMNMIPGANDEVYLFNGFQIFIEEQANCSSLAIQERYLQTWEFDNLLHTVEGQFRVSLGHKVGKKQSLDGVEFDIPTKSPIVVKKLVVSQRDDRLGLANPNRKNATLALICQYIKCPSLEDVCIEPVQPVGHCCPACGAIINFTGMETDKVNLLDHLLAEFVRKNLLLDMDLNLERLDEDGAPVDYQITVFPSKNKTFSEERITLAIEILEKVLDKHTAHQNAIFHYEHKISKMDIKLQTGSKILGAVVSLLIIGTMVLYALKLDTNIFVRVTRPNNIYTGVIWRRGSTGDQIQLVNTNHIDNQNFTSNPEEEVQVDVIQQFENETVAPKEDMTLISLHEPIVNAEQSEVEELPLVEF